MRIEKVYKYGGTYKADFRSNGGSKTVDLGSIETCESGVTEAEKSLILTLFRNATYTSPNMADTLAQLEELWGSGGEEPDEPATKTYTVFNELVNVSSSNAATTVNENAIYTTTLTADEGYEISVVTVTMGGVDIAADVYTEDGTILITEVTGDIVITAKAVSTLAVAYVLPNEVTWTGTDNTEYDTGYVAYPNGDRTITYCIELTTNISQWKEFNMVNPGAAVGLNMSMTNGQKWNVSAHNGKVEVFDGGKMTNKRFVMQSTKDNKIAYAWSLVDGVVTKYTCTGYNYFPEATKTTVKLGTSTAYLVGTVHDFRVYEQTLTDAQIEAYLNGGDL